MDVIVRSRKAPVPPTLRTIAQRKLDRLGRLAGDASRAEIILTEERNPRIEGRHVCAITLHMPHGLVTAHASAPAPEAALDLVLDKVRHQVEQRKNRRLSRVHAARRSGRPRRTPS